MTEKARLGHSDPHHRQREQKLRLFCREALKYDIFRHEALKYDIFYRENVVYAL